jgi:protein involved in polysaccharide export with SLBB domain
VKIAVFARVFKVHAGFAIAATLALAALPHVVLAADSASGPPPAIPTTLPTPTGVDGSYLIDVDDTISISVARHGDVSGVFRIPPDGLVHMQRLTTPIDVRGKTTAQLVDEVTAKLQSEGKLVLHPGQVSVSVVGLRMHRIYVRGNGVVGREMDLKEGWRLDDLIAVMGGLPQPDRVTVVLTNPKRPAPLPVDITTAQRDPFSPANIVLQEGDTLTVTMPQAKRLMIKGEGPRGMHDVDERFGLRQALISFGFSVTGASGDLKHARIIRNAKPGDYSTTATYIPVDILALMRSDTTPDIPFQDLDTLEIPISDDYVYVFGEIGGPRKFFLPQDRPMHLLDVYANAGDVTGNAKMGRVSVAHEKTAGVYDNAHSYDLGKLVKNGDMKQNPEILPHDLIYVPSNNRTDPINSVWTAWGLFGIVKALVPTIP